mgnify:FL=1
MKDTETIHSGIPLPIEKRGKSSRWDKFVGIEVGQCVFVETRKEANSLKIYLSRHGMKVATRSVDGQFGVWRVADE